MGCPDCGGQLVVDWTRGEVVCSQCGLVVEEFAVDTGPEWRVAELRQARTAPLKIASVTEVSAGPEHGSRWLALAKFNRGTLHGRERALASLIAKVRRIAACMNMPRRVVDEAEALAKRYAISGRDEAIAVALLWLAARRMGTPRPLRELMRCGGVERTEMTRAVAKLAVVARSINARPRLEEHVRTVAARLNLPAETAKRALEILQRNKRLLVGRNPWVCAAAALHLAANRQITVSQLAATAGVTVYPVKQLARRLKA